MLSLRSYLAGPLPSRVEQVRFDREAYQERNRIERLIDQLKQFRRIATRYAKRAIDYLAILTIGMSLLWL